MALNKVTKTVVDRSLKVARTPVDLALKAAGASKSPAKLALDRAEAGVRGAAGTVLRNPKLKQEAESRELAAAERERALRLEQEAEQREQVARERAEGEREAAAEKRAEADRQAQRRRTKRRNGARRKRRKQRKQRTRASRPPRSQRRRRKNRTRRSRKRRSWRASRRRNGASTPKPKRRKSSVRPRPSPTLLPRPSAHAKKTHERLDRSRAGQRDGGDEAAAGAGRIVSVAAVQLHDAGDQRQPEPVAAAARRRCGRRRAGTAR